MDGYHYVGLTLSFRDFELAFFDSCLALLYGIFDPFSTPFPTTPAAVGPGPTAALPFAAPLPNIFLTPPNTFLANHGVAQTLKMTLPGRRTFVIAYAVATSTNILLPLSPTLHPSFFTSSTLASAVIPSFRISPPLFSTAPSTATLSNPNHLFLAKYLPNFCTPSETAPPSAITYRTRNQHLALGTSHIVHRLNPHRGPRSLRSVQWKEMAKLTSGIHPVQ